MTETNSTRTGTSPGTEQGQNEPGTVPHIVIVGGGFGGLTAAKKLGNKPVRVTLIDRNNYHLFQPMLYQVATSGLVPANIAAPIRDSLHRYKKNTTVLLDEVTGVDTQQQLVILRDQPPVHYDYLILATGAESNYFGHPEWASDSPGMKTLADGLQVQQTILGAFEEAEKEPDEKKRKRLLTFVFIGAGPTGVELAAASATHINHILGATSSASARVMLVDTVPETIKEACDRLRKAYIGDFLADLLHDSPRRWAPGCANRSRSIVTISCRPFCIQPSTSYGQASNWRMSTSMTRERPQKNGTKGNARITAARPSCTALTRCTPATADLT